MKHIPDEHWKNSTTAAANEYEVLGFSTFPHAAAGGGPTVIAGGSFPSGPSVANNHANVFGGTVMPNSASDFSSEPTYTDAFGVPTYRNPLAGGVPVLPAVVSPSYVMILQELTVMTLSSIY